MDNRISVEEYCSYYQIDVDFIRQLAAHGLVTLPVANEENFLSADEFPKIEKFIHLHYDLEINLEGIEAIYHLLERMDNLQKKINYLHNRLIVHKVADL